MKLAAIAKLIKADGYCKLYKVFYDDCRTYDLYIGTKTAIFPLTGRIGIRYCGCELVPMIEPVSGTVGFVDAKQIMPVADEIRKSGYFKYCARKMASGGRYYVIKDGMVVRGAVLPVKLEPLAKSGLRELADMVKKTRDVADVEDLSEQEDKNDA